MQMSRWCAISVLVMLGSSCSDGNDNETTTTDTTTSIASSSTSGAEATTPPSSDASAALDPFRDKFSESPCFDLKAGFELPDGYSAGSIQNEQICQFVFQKPGELLDTVLIGELMTSSSGRNFSLVMKQIEAELENGQELEFSALPNVEVLNKPASGNKLDIVSRQQFSIPDSANRATVLKHESSRFSDDTASSNDSALTAIVEVPAPTDGPTQYVMIWAVSNETNDQLMADVVESLETKFQDFPSNEAAE